VRIETIFIHKSNSEKQFPLTLQIESKRRQTGSDKQYFSSAAGRRDSSIATNSISSAFSDGSSHRTTKLVPTSGQTVCVFVYPPKTRSIVSLRTREQITSHCESVTVQTASPIKVKLVSVELLRIAAIGSSQLLRVKDSVLIVNSRNVVHSAINNELALISFRLCFVEAVKKSLFF
jgi:hypothetical protein